MTRILLLLAGLSAVIIAPAAAGKGTIVRGALLRGPVTPVCVEGRPCGAAVPGATIVFRRGGKEVATVTTSVRGRFSLRLAPGTYGIRVLNIGSLARVTPRAVRVPASGAIWLRLDVDTGIRTPEPPRVD